MTIYDYDLLCSQLLLIVYLQTIYVCTQLICASTAVLFAWRAWISDSKETIFLISPEKVDILTANIRWYLTRMDRRLCVCVHV